MERLVSKLSGMKFHPSFMFETLTSENVHRCVVLVSDEKFSLVRVREIQDGHLNSLRTSSYGTTVS